ncbi:hypothetical protein GGI22_002793 [Coemansia erecta]|nr:hypothetical protein GGI22_002793 [Coemansia erecta]
MFVSSSQGSCCLEKAKPYLGFVVFFMGIFEAGIGPAAPVILSPGALRCFTDRAKNRGFFIAASATLACIGYILLISSNKIGANYAGACFVAMGLYPIIPLMLSWVANNNVGHIKRAISIAMLNTFGQCFATVGTQIYKIKTAPRFFMGYGVCLAFTVVMIVFAISLSLILKRENARRDATYGAPKQLTTEEH